MLPAPTLDLRTIVLLTGALACVMSLVLHLQRRSYPSPVRGMGQWTLAPLMALGASGLIGLRGMVPDTLSLGIANALVFQSAFLFLSGSCHFLGQPLHRAVLPVQALASVLILPQVITTETAYADRVMIMCALLGGVLAWHAWLLCTRARRSFANRFTAAVLALQAAVFLVRGATVTVLPPSEGLFAPSAIQTVYLISHGFGLLLVSMGVVLMATEKRRDELHHMVSRDSLTGALTRRALLDLGESELMRCRRQAQPLSVLMLDLDFFRSVNDQNGHRIGDLVIRDFVGRVDALLRPPAVLGRYGVEAFVVVMPDADLMKARLLAERIRESATTDTSLPRCQVSIGVATSAASSDESLDALIDRADLGLHQAKAQGRNRVAWVESAAKWTRPASLETQV